MHEHTPQYFSFYINEYGFIFLKHAFTAHFPAIALKTKLKVGKVESVPQ